MPARNKRKAEEFDPTKSDSADSTYGASASRSTRSRPARSQPGKQPARKKQRRKLDDDLSDEISNDSLLSDASFDEHVEEELEIDENTGRPKRQAAKNRPIYQEESEDEIEDDEDAPILAPQEIPTPKKKGREPKSLLLKLNVSTPQSNPPAPTRRSARARSGSAGVIRAMPSASTQIRRSSRIAHDDSDPIVALTDSGHHMDIIRPGTRSPETNTTRAKRGGKGIKKLPTSVVYEEEEETTAPHHQTEVAASNEDPDEEREDFQLAVKTDEIPTRDDSELLHDVPRDEVAVIPESGDDEQAEEGDEEEEEEEEEPISQLRRTRQSDTKKSEHGLGEAAGQVGDVSARPALRSARPTRKVRSSQKSGREESSDFEPGFDEAGEEDISDSEASISSPRKASQPNDEDNSSPGTRGAGKGKSRSQRPGSDEHDSEVAEELAEELQDLRSSRSRRTAQEAIIYQDRPKTRTRKKVDYRMIRPDLPLLVDDDAPPSAITPSRRAKGGGGGTWQRSLFSTQGPFGGFGEPPPVLGGPGGIGAAAGAYSDSSDDDMAPRPRAPGMGGAVGMTPTAAAPAVPGLFPAALVHGTDAWQGAGATPASLGKLKDKSLLADADPLGVDQNVNFDGVGGLEGHIHQLKEMVTLPLLYPEIFQQLRVTPPRGVLFHGPPGTGKTLLARALASRVSSHGRKVTFYMRKGADALSKWVGEAEKQLRLLFEAARATQPSIIFFDEIDGLAPVRSSKQEQIHASIVSTLLALMDGMDGRGQVIVIGATNRPDSIDPALRRPGRFDREFYFPLPNTEARRSILDIHTKGWNPPLTPDFKDEIARQTKGYGGADLRALCTEAALNAVQRRYPQIYKSNEKLEIKPETINVTAKDFIISIKKIVPSSQRSASSGAAPLPVQIEPLLRKPLEEIEKLVGELLPQKKPLTALEEAEFEEAEDDQGMKTERIQQEFERSRIFRPRLLVKGLPGMGQQYLAAALLNLFEGLHLQSFDLSILLGDSSRSPDAAVIQLFTEARRHKPSVIYIPNVDTWYRTVGEAVISVFQGLVRSLVPTEPVLILGILESQHRDIDPQMIKDLFGFSRRNQFELDRPMKPARQEFFSAVMDYINKAPTDFPESTARKKRQLEVLKPVPPETPKTLVLSKAQQKLQKDEDKYALNLLKLRIQPIMDQIKSKYKKFRTGIIDDSQIGYLFDEVDPDVVSTDLPPNKRKPYERSMDKDGVAGLLEVASGKFYYNMESVTIEKRLSNGYYKRPKDFLRDVKKLAKDAKTLGEAERLLKAKELQANVAVDIRHIETENPPFMEQLEALYNRELQREKELLAKASQAESGNPQSIPGNVSGEIHGLTDGQSSGPVILGEPMRNGIALHPTTPSNPSNPSQPSQRSILTNGLHTGGVISDLSDLQPHSSSNGTTGPRESDLQMTTTTDEGHSTERETQNSSFGPSAQTRPPFSYTGGPASLEQRKSLPGSLSQRSAITPMAEGSNPQDYTNYASTTTSSGKRGSSGPFNTQNTQSSHGRNEGPDFSMIPEPLASNSQIPDTQGSQSTSNPTSTQSLSQHPTQPASQYPAVPPFNRPPNPAGIQNILTTDVAPKHSSAVSKLVIDPAMTDQLLKYLTDQTSGFSVEQLEQVYSALMNQIWKTRGEWNRSEVIMEVKAAFEEVRDDIKYCQDLLDGSMEIGTQDGGTQYGASTAPYGTARYDNTKYGTSTYGEIEG